MVRISRAEQQQQTCKALVEAARRHFADDGYGRASLDKIAADAGYTRGAIYANFDGRPGLFLAVLDARLEDQIRELEAIGSDLAQLGRWRRANAQKERGLAWAVTEFRAAALRDDDLRDQFRDRERTLRRAFADLIGRRAADLKITLPVPVEQVAAALLALGDGLTEQHQLDPEGVDPATFDTVLATLIQGAKRSE